MFKSLFPSRIYFGNKMIMNPSKQSFVQDNIKKGEGLPHGKR